MENANPQWEYFCDISYYDMWCVRRKIDTKFGEGFHVPSKEEAKALCELLNKAKA